MRLIISSTNRLNSYSLKISKIVKNIYQEFNEEGEVFDLRKVPFHEVLSEPYPEVLPPELKKACDTIANASSLVIVCPEYNGSFPGIFKFFLDHWHFPKSFEHKPVCFIGIGGRFGGLRPVEHLENLFTYRKSFVFSHKVFISNVQSLVKEGRLEDEMVLSLLKKQAKNFTCFSRALQDEKFD